MRRVACLTALLSMFVLGAFPASAIPYFPPPTPVYEAPIDRALTNVEAMLGIEPAQKEQILGRLNLLAYARDDAPFAYLRDENRINIDGDVPCSEANPGMPRNANAPTPHFAPDEKCAVFVPQIGPWRELPQNVPDDLGAAAHERLAASETHYARAITLDGDNLRSRLGHAYVLDRLGRTKDARSELRNILRLGLPRVASPQSDWEDHAVLSETVEHLSYLARNAADRTQVAQLRARLETSRPQIYVTPIVVPLTDGAFSTIVDTHSRVQFDFAGTGDKRAQGWLTPNAAWLVWDPTWRGDVHSGFDLIGARTWAVFWRDGFEALRALDDNHDGQLTGDELGGLSLWRDDNGDGVSTPDEVIPVEAHGIVSIATRGARTRPGLITAPSGVRFDNGVSRPLYDWTPGVRARVS